MTAQNSPSGDRGLIEMILAYIVGAVLIVALGVGIFFASGLFSQKTANFRGETSKRNQVEANGAFRVQAYDHFFDLCTAVQSDEASIVNLQTELKSKPSPSRTEQINASITALANNRAQTIAQYNNDAAKDYTAGQFRSNHLPPRLDPSQEATTCAI